MERLSVASNLLSAYSKEDEVVEEESRVCEREKPKGSESRGNQRSGVCTVVMGNGNVVSHGNSFASNSYFVPINEDEATRRRKVRIAGKVFVMGDGDVRGGTRAGSSEIFVSGDRNFVSSNNKVVINEYKGRKNCNNR